MPAHQLQGFNRTPWSRTLVASGGGDDSSARVLAQRESSRPSEPPKSQWEDAVRLGRSIRGMLIAVITAVAWIAPVQAIDGYTVVPLDKSLTDGTYANDVNASGQAAGYLLDGSRVPVPVRYRDGGVEFLELPTGWTSGEGFAINDSGIVAGRLENEAGILVPATWTGTSVSLLPTLGGASGWAFDINRAGEVVGYSTDSSDSVRASRWSNGTLADLGTLGGRWAYAQGINDSGDIVGISSLTGDAQARAFLWRGGVMTDLGVLPGDDYSYAVTINARGVVAGGNWNRDGTSRAIIWDGPSIRALPMFGSDITAFPYGINDAGDVVGESYDAAWALHPVVWPASGGVFDLNVLLRDTGWDINGVRGIDNQGRIVGQGIRFPSGLRAAILVVPPTPPVVFSPFAQPIDGGSSLNVMKGGAVAPIRFSATDGGTPLTDPSAIAVSVRQVTCSGGGLADDVETLAATAASLRYDTSSGMFVMNWKAPRAPGTCWDVSFDARGAELVAHFRLR